MTVPGGVQQNAVCPVCGGAMEVIDVHEHSTGNISRTWYCSGTVRRLTFKGWRIFAVRYPWKGNHVPTWKHTSGPKMTTPVDSGIADLGVSR